MTFGLKNLSSAHTEGTDIGEDGYGFE